MQTAVKDTLENKGRVKERAHIHQVDTKKMKMNDHVAPRPLDVEISLQLKGIHANILPASALSRKMQSIIQMIKKNAVKTQKNKQ